MVNKLTSRNEDLLTNILASNLVTIDVGTTNDLWSWAKTKARQSYIHGKVGAALKETQSKIRNIQKTLFKKTGTASQEDSQAPIDFRQAAEVKSSTF